MLAGGAGDNGRIMSDVFLHGVEVVDGVPKPAPLALSNQGVIGIVGTAGEADAELFPIDTPVLIAGSVEEAAALGKVGSLPGALRCMFAQCLPQVVVVRVAGDGEGNGGKVGDLSGALNAVLGGYDAEKDAYSGVHVFKVAKSRLGVAPKILIAPGFSNNEAVGNELVKVADELRASVILDGPNSNDAEALEYAALLSKHGNVLVVDPQVKVADVGAEGGFSLAPASSFVAAVMAGQSYSASPSNVVLSGVSGLAREVDFRHGDANCRANLLNKGRVATVIREDGFRLWGNLAADGAFLCSYRIKDYMSEGLRAIFFPHVDRGLTEAKVDYLLIRANEFLQSMVKEGALVSATATAPKDLNTAERRRNGHLTIAVAYEDVSPMQRVTIELNYSQEG